MADLSKCLVPPHRRHSGGRYVLCSTGDFSRRRRLSRALRPLRRSLDDQQAFDWPIKLSAGAIDVIAGQLQRLTEQGNTKPGFTFLLSLAISIRSANVEVKALFEAVNIVHGKREKRSVIKLNEVSFAFTCGALLFMLLALVALVLLPLIVDYLGLTDTARSAGLRGARTTDAVGREGC